MAVERRAPAQVFGPGANTLVVVSFIGAALGLAALILVWMLAARSNYVRQVGVANAPTQPMPFSHQVHAGGLKLQCQYCHNAVAESPYANLPATETCMTCHSQIATVNRPDVQPVRDSWLTNTPVQWTKVHDLPDFVYFNHAVHVNNGVGCSTCHGDVANTPYPMRKVEPMYMSWCLNCHRNPEQFLRPAAEIYNTAYVPPPPAQQAALGAQLVKEFGIKKENLTNCWICHR